MVENSFKMPKANHPEDFKEQTVFKVPKEEKAASPTKLNENSAGSLSYLLGFVSAIFFLMIEKENQVVRFHALQSICFSLIFITVFSAVSMLPGVGWIVGAILSPIGLVTWIILMLSAANGKKIKLLYIGEFVEGQLSKANTIQKEK